MQRDVLASPHAHPELQTFEPIESPHAFVIYGPSFPPQ
jgi:hypothetical protein